MIHVQHFICGLGSLYQKTSEQFYIVGRELFFFTYQLEKSLNPVEVVFLFLATTPEVAISESVAPLVSLVPAALLLAFKYFPTPPPPAPPSAVPDPGLLYHDPIFS